MTDDKINQTIHEAMGWCWHKYAGDGWTCVCGYSNGGAPYGIAGHIDGNNPDYTSDWSAWGAALEWAKEKKWWIEFKDWAWKSRAKTRLHKNDWYLWAVEVFFSLMTSPEQGSAILAKFIDKNPEYFTKEEKR